MRPSKTGYIHVQNPGHPRANMHGYVKRATLVAEAKIGRLLVAHEIVHHINGIKDDDRPENLEVMTNKEHTALHHRLKYLASLHGSVVRYGRPLARNRPSKSD